MKANNAMEGWTEAMVNVEDAKKQEKMANERRFAYRCALETSKQQGWWSRHPFEMPDFLLLNQTLLRPKKVASIF